MKKCRHGQRLSEGVGEGGGGPPGKFVRSRLSKILYPSLFDDFLVF